MKNPFHKNFPKENSFSQVRKRLNENSNQFDWLQLKFDSFKPNNSDVFFNIFYIKLKNQNDLPPTPMFKISDKMFQEFMRNHRKFPYKSNKNEMFRI